MLSQKKESLIGLDHKHNMETNLSNTYTHTSKNVIPTNYELMLKPDLNTFTFQGEVNITVDISKPVDSITLNSAELDIKEIAIKTGDANIIPSSINSHEDNEKGILPQPNLSRLMQEEHFPAGMNLNVKQPLM